MADILHSVVDPESRHAVHAITPGFATTTARDAHVYDDTDFGKIVTVVSPRKFYLITAVSAGIATFLEIGASVASLISNDSAVTGTTVKDALNQLETDMAALVPSSRQISAGSGLTGGGTLAADRTLAADFGSAAGKVCQGDDSRLSDARTPTAHAASHLPGGTDALTTAAAGTITPGDSAAVGSAASFARSDHTHAIAAFGSTAGTFCEGSDARLSDARTPTAGSLGVYLSDAAPSSAHSCSTEFTSDPGWSTVDVVSTIVSYSVADSHAQLRVSGNSSFNRIVGKYRNIPTDSEWTVWAKLNLAYIQASNALSIGLFLAEDASNPTTKKFETCSCEYGTGFGDTFRAEQWASYNSLTGTRSGGTSSKGGYGGYVRMGYDGTNFTYFGSQDCKTWVRLTSIAKPFTPLHVGFYIQNTTPNDVFGVFDFVRFKAGVGTSGLFTLLDGNAL